MEGTGGKLKVESGKPGRDLSAEGRERSLQECDVSAFKCRNIKDCSLPFLSPRT